MANIKDICKFLDEYAPTRLAEEWDNVGLLVGDPAGTAGKIMTCLTVTPESVAEAIETEVDLIVSHHPLPFRPMKRITTDQVPTKMVWDLIRAGVAIYSPHTGFDSAVGGINQMLADKLSLEKTKPLVPIEDDPQGLGAGRVGESGFKTVGELVNMVKQQFGMKHIKCVGELDQPVSKVAIACGSGGSFLSKAKRVGCDTFVTGEAAFHSCLEAKASNVALILLGHYVSERFAVEALVEHLQNSFSDCEVWASEKESDPISWY